MRPNRSASTTGRRPDVEDINQRRNSHGARSSENVRMSPIAKFLVFVSNKITNAKLWYKKNILYWRETVLLLVAVVAFLVTSVGAVLARRSSSSPFPNSVFVLLYRLLIVTWGSLNYFIYEEVFERYRCLAFMVRHYNSQVTLRDVLDFPRTNKSKWWMKVLVGLLVGINVFTTFTVEEIPALSPGRIGHIARLKTPLSIVGSVSTQAILENAAGMFTTCSDCIVYETKSYSFLPVSSRLVDGITSEVENILHILDDILAVNSTCTQVPFFGPTLGSRKARFGINYANHTADGSKLGISLSYGKSGNEITQQCIIEILNRRGTAEVVFERGPAELFWPTRVTSVTSAKQDCIQFDDICLQKSEKADLSMFLVSSSLQLGSYEIDDYLLPSRLSDSTITQEKFEHFIREYAVFLLKLSVQNLESQPEDVLIYISSVAKNIIENAMVVSVYLIILAVYVVILLALLGSKLYAVNMLNSQEIDFLQKSLYPGAFRFSVLFKLMNQVSKTENGTALIVKLGEDKSTVDEKKGCLRYGTPDEVVPIQNDREYYYFES